MPLPRCHNLFAFRMSERLTVEGLNLADYVENDDLVYAAALASERTGQDVCGLALTSRGMATLHCDRTGDGSDYNTILNAVISDIVRKRDPSITKVWRDGRPIEHDCRDVESVSALMDVVARFHWTAVRHASVDSLNQNHIRFDVLDCHDRKRSRRHCPRPKCLGFSTRPPTADFQARLPEGLQRLRRKQLKDQLRLAIGRQEGEARRENQRVRRCGMRRGRGACRFVGDDGRKAWDLYLLWRQFYDECRELFRCCQDVVFPAGTVRFRALGAICDPRRHVGMQDLPIPV
jgi:hypothetical protein